MRAPIVDIYDFAVGKRENFEPTKAEYAEHGRLYAMYHGITAGMVITLATGPTAVFGETIITQNENGITLNELMEAGETSLWCQGAILAVIGAQALAHLATRD